MEEKLIIAVCGHPVLYGTAAVFYRDKIKKEEAWVKLCASLEDFMNPDTAAGGYPAFLDLVQQVQRSNGGDISHDRRLERQARWTRTTRWTRIVQNDQAARYKHLKRLYSRLSRLV